MFGDHEGFKPLIEMKEYLSRGKIRNAFIQSVALIALGVVLSLAVNGVRPEGLVVPGSWDPSVAAGMQNPGFGLITPDDAWSWYTQEKVLFVDAREPYAYEQGHLPGALNVPTHNIEKYLEHLQSLVKAGIVLIPYCESPDCPLSYELAGILKTYGIYPVRVLNQGWIGWYEAGFPYEGSPSE